MYIYNDITNVDIGTSSCSSYLYIQSSVLYPERCCLPFTIFIYYICTCTLWVGVQRMNEKQWKFLKKNEKSYRWRSIYFVYILNISPVIKEICYIANQYKLNCLSKVCWSFVNCFFISKYTEIVLPSILKYFFFF